MKFTAFNATCPFEIGDKIKTRKLVREDMAARARLSPATVIEEEHTITDIVCMNYVRSGKTEFLTNWTTAGSWCASKCRRDRRNRNGRRRNGRTKRRVVEQVKTAVCFHRNSWHISSGGSSNTAPDRTESRRPHDDHKNFRLLPL